MNIVTREDVQVFNATLVDAFYEGESVASIAARTGRSPSTIQKLVDTDKLENGPRERKRKPRDPRVMIDKKALSPRHTWIGLAIARYRSEHDMTPTAFGMLISASRVVVRNMEIGAHDFSLCQIERLSTVLSISFDNLIRPPYSQ